MKKKELAEKAGISIATITKMGKDGAVVSSDVLVKIEPHPIYCRFRFYETFLTSHQILYLMSCIIPHTKLHVAEITKNQLRCGLMPSINIPIHIS